MKNNTTLQPHQHRSKPSNHTSDAHNAIDLSTLSIPGVSPQRPEERRYFLTVYGRSINEYFLCKKKHADLDEAVACLKRRGDLLPGVEIHEICERLIYDGRQVATYDPDGELRSRDMLHERMIAMWEIEYTDALKDGSSMSLVEIKQKIEKEEAERKAARKARRLVNAARKRDEAQRKQAAAEKGGEHVSDNYAPLRS